MTNTAPPTFDPDGEILSQIGGLYPWPDIDNTPAGRMAALDLDTCLVYAELYDVLRDMPPDVEQQAPDLMGELVDLHKRTERTFDAQFARRWGW